jgi:hypothetical protein
MLLGRSHFLKYLLIDNWWIVNNKHTTSHVGANDQDVEAVWWTSAYCMGHHLRNESGNTWCSLTGHLQVLQMLYSLLYIYITIVQNLCPIYLFIYLCLSSQWLRLHWVEWIVNNELESAGRNRFCLKLQNYLDIFLEGLTKTTKGFNQNNRWQGRDPNWAPPERNSEALTFEQACSIKSTPSRAI